MLSSLHMHKHWEVSKRPEMLGWGSPEDSQASTAGYWRVYLAPAPPVGKTKKNMMKGREAGTNGSAGHQSLLCVSIHD